MVLNSKKRALFFSAGKQEMNTNTYEEIQDHNHGKIQHRHRCESKTRGGCVGKFIGWYLCVASGQVVVVWCLLPLQLHSYRAFTRFRWNALRQRMAEEESGAWGSHDTRDVIVRLTGQQTNHAASYLVGS